MRSRFLTLSLTVSALGAAALTGCSSATDGSEAAAFTDADSTIVIDVRTPAEFAEGHLEGALNADVSGLDFETQLADLDPEGIYAVYCRSGNRSAQAASVMTEAGFTDVIDLGSLNEAAQATDLPIVSD